MMKNYPEFKNVSVIVTGVASGIGRAQAEKFLLEGAFVFGGAFSRGMRNLAEHGRNP